MGDRCNAYLTIHGRIETIEALDAVLMGLEQEGFGLTFRGVEPCLTLAREMLSALNANRSPDYEAEEVNYGDISEAETPLQEHGIAYAASHGDGGGYDAVAWSWTPGRYTVGTIETKDCGAVIPLSYLSEALTNPNPLQSVIDLVNRARAATGEGMPTFSVSDSVRAELERRFADKVAA